MGRDSLIAEKLSVRGNVGKRPKDRVSDWMARRHRVTTGLREWATHSMLAVVFAVAT